MNTLKKLIENKENYGKDWRKKIDKLCELNLSEYVLNYNIIANRFIVDITVKELQNLNESNIESIVQKYHNKVQNYHKNIKQKTLNKKNNIFINDSAKELMNLIDKQINELGDYDSNNLTKIDSIEYRKISQEIKYYLYSIKSKHWFKFYNNNQK